VTVLSEQGALKSSASAGPSGATQSKYHVIPVGSVRIRDAITTEKAALLVPPIC